MKTRRINRRNRTRKHGGKKRRITKVKRGGTRLFGGFSTSIEENFKAIQAGPNIFGRKNYRSTIADGLFFYLGYRIGDSTKSNDGEQTRLLQKAKDYYFYAAQGKMHIATAMAGFAGMSEDKKTEYKKHTYDGYETRFFDYACTWAKQQKDTVEISQETPKTDMMIEFNNLTDNAVERLNNIYEMDFTEKDKSFYIQQKYTKYIDGYDTTNTSFTKSEDRFKIFHMVLRYNAFTHFKITGEKLTFTKLYDYRYRMLDEILKETEQFLQYKTMESIVSELLEKTKEAEEAAYAASPEGLAAAEAEAEAEAEAAEKQYDIQRTLDVLERVKYMKNTISAIADIEDLHRDKLDQCKTISDDYAKTNNAADLVYCVPIVEFFKKYYELKSRISKLKEQSRVLVTEDITETLDSTQNELLEISKISKVDLKNESNRKDYYLKISRIKVKLDRIEKKLKAEAAKAAAAEAAAAEAAKAAAEAAAAEAKKLTDKKLGSTKTSPQRRLLSHNSDK